MEWLIWTYDILLKIFPLLGFYFLVRYTKKSVHEGNTADAIDGFLWSLLAISLISIHYVFNIIVGVMQDILELLERHDPEVVEQYVRYII